MNIKHIVTGKKEAVDFFHKERPCDSHKGDYGRVYIIGGSTGMTGAASLCALAALHSGAGLVYLLAKPALVPIYEILVPEAVKITINGNQDKSMTQACFNTKDIDEIYDKIKNPSCIVLGPGLGANPETGKFVREFIKQYSFSPIKDVPIIIDADAINSFEGKTKILSRYIPENAIITPHCMEASRLIGVDADTINGNKKNYAQKIAEEVNAITVLKGHKTQIAGIVEEEMIVCENTTGNPAMATGGSGDVLAGIIAGFIATDYKQVSLFDCVRYAVYIHGLCGDIAKNKYGSRYLTASLLIDQLKEIDFNG